MDFSAGQEYLLIYTGVSILKTGLLLNSGSVPRT